MPQPSSEPLIGPMAGAELLTYLTAAPALVTSGALPQAGDRLEFRRGRDGHAVEAWSAGGQLLGRLPPGEWNAIAAALSGPSAAGRITAIVPRPRAPGAGRIHIAVSGG